MLAKRSLDSYWKPEVYVSQSQEISSSITQSWTPQAIECYELKSECKKCSIHNANYSFVCQMPKVIKHLVKSIGEPVID